MSVVIDQPEIEALIQQRLASGAFQNAEEVLMHALKSAPIPPANKGKKNLAQFLLDSPLTGSGLELQRAKDYPRDVEL
jgi:SOS response regulatory protein OraA/RecX